MRSPQTCGSRSTQSAGTSGWGRSRPSLSAGPGASTGQRTPSGRRAPRSRSSSTRTGSNRDPLLPKLVGDAAGNPSSTEASRPPRIVRGGRSCTPHIPPAVCVIPPPGTPFRGRIPCNLDYSCLPMHAHPCPVKLTTCNALTCNDAGQRLARNRQVRSSILLTRSHAPSRERRPAPRPVTRAPTRRTRRAPTVHQSGGIPHDLCVLDTPELASCRRWPDVRKDARCPAPARRPCAAVSGARSP